VSLRSPRDPDSQRLFIQSLHKRSLRIRCQFNRLHEILLNKHAIRNRHNKQRYNPNVWRHGRLSRVLQVRQQPIHRQRWCKGEHCLKDGPEEHPSHGCFGERDEFPEGSDVLAVDVLLPPKFGPVVIWEGRQVVEGKLLPDPLTDEVVDVEECEVIGERGTCL